MMQYLTNKKFNSKTDNITINSNQNNNYTNYFFEYLSQSIANNIIKAFKMPNVINQTDNHLFFGQKQQYKNDLSLDNNLFSIGINDNNQNIYQIKKNNRIKTPDILNENPNKESLKNENIQKMLHKRKENINKFILDYRLKNTQNVLILTKIKFPN